MENLKILSRSLQVSIDELLGNKIPLEKEVVKEKEVIYVHNRYTYEKRYRSKLSICGIPLVDINVGRGRTEEGYWRVAKGIIAIGNVSVGVISIGFKFAIGALAYGEIAMGTNPVGDIVYHLRSSNTCFIDSREYMQFQEYLSRESLPKIIEFFVQVIPLC